MRFQVFVAQLLIGRCLLKILKPLVHPCIQGNIGGIEHPAALVLRADTGCNRQVGVERQECQDRVIVGNEVMDFLVLKEAEELLHIHLAAADDFPAGGIAERRKFNLSGEMGRHVEQFRIIRHIAVAADEHGKGGGMRYGESNADGVVHLIRKIDGDDVIVARKDALLHFGGVGAEGEAGFQPQRITKLVDEFVLETDGAAFIKEIIRRVAMEQDGDAVGRILHKMGAGLLLMVGKADATNNNSNHQGGGCYEEEKPTESFTESQNYSTGVTKMS